MFCILHVFIHKERDTHGVKKLWLLTSLSLMSWTIRREDVCKERLRNFLSRLTSETSTLFALSFILKEKLKSDQLIHSSATELKLQLVTADLHSVKMQHWLIHNFLSNVFCPKAPSVSDSERCFLQASFYLTGTAKCLPAVDDRKRKVAVFGIWM